MKKFSAVSPAVKHLLYKRKNTQKKYLKELYVMLPKASWIKSAWMQAKLNNVLW
jgi:hypothetical protein